MDEDETDSGYSTSINDNAKVHIKDQSNGTTLEQRDINGHKVTNGLKTYRRPSPLQIKMEKQREASRKREAGRQRESPKKPRQQSNNSPLVDQQPRRSALVSIDRLAVPWKTTALDRQPSEQPLVSIDSESEDEFDIVALSSAPSQTTENLRQQLLKDGFRLDEIPDDEELDLIPPRPMNERCICCQTTQVTCSIQ
ncbi:protein FAM219A-like [Patiria miniata]|uniref:Protein FAM219A n=1 Tax=Patiria miniata TaxID=46514 RepID=A0A914BL80_PATMI|nr:protein FAM219A-like [Patiria miniata]